MNPADPFLDVLGAYLSVTQRGFWMKVRGANWLTGRKARYRWINYT